MVKRIEIETDDGKKILLPPGSKVIYQDGGRTTYKCPDEDIVEVNEISGTIRNVTRDIELGKPRKKW